jgi:SpoVK/Ycf46/Vps4 family AAA+-type ATPase
VKVTNCNFQEYTVVKYNDTEVKIAGKIWVETVKLIEDYIVTGKDVVITIVGEPGMGKTTILKAIKKDLSEKVFIIDLELVNSDSLSTVAWKHMRNPYEGNTSLYEKVKGAAYSILESNKENIGYTGWARISKEFRNWLRHICDKRKWDERLGYAERLYCMSYETNVDGFIQFLNDLAKIGKIGLLVDEIKALDGHLQELHKIINESRIPIAVTMTTDVFNEIKDRALKRRLSEIKVELKLNNEDKLDILKAYCPDLAEELINLKDIRDADTVNKLLDIARDTVKIALEKCKEAYRVLECVKDNVKDSWNIEDINEVSVKLEKAIREGLLELKDIYKITYVHDKGKEIKERHVRVDIFFIWNNMEFIGDIKLSNMETLEEGNIKNIKKLEDFDKDGNIKVVKFIVTNVNNVNLPKFKVILVDNKTIYKIVNGDKETRDNFIKRMLSELTT